MPLGLTEKAADAFKSIEATLVAPQDKSISTGFLEPRVGIDLIKDFFNEIWSSSMDILHNPTAVAVSVIAAASLAIIYVLKK